MLVVSSLRCTLLPTTRVKTPSSEQWIVQTQLYGAGARTSEAATTEGSVTRSIKSELAVGDGEIVIAWLAEVVNSLPMS